MCVCVCMCNDILSSYTLNIKNMGCILILEEEEENIEEYEISLSGWMVKLLLIKLTKRGQLILEKC